MARAFAPLALSVELDVADDGSALDGRLRVHAASDLIGAVAGTLRVDVHLWATAPAWPAHSLELPVSIAAEASAMVHEVSLVALGLGPGAKIAREDAFMRLSFEPNDASAAPGAVPSTKASAAPSKDPLRFSAHFLLAVEEAQQQFETNPFFWILHESIYCDGGANVDGARGPSSWAAERLLAAQGAAWDCTTRLTPGSPPVLLTGEHVFSWMADDYAWLRQLKPAAELLAAKADWGPLYDRAVLGQREGPPVAALVSYEDIYVERAFSEETAAMLGGRARLWITNEFQHSGLRDDPSVFERLLAMSKGEVAIPS